MTLTLILAWLRRVPMWAWAALAAVVLLVGAYRWAYHRGAESVQSEWDAERAQNKLAADAQKAEAAAKEAKDAAAFAMIADNLRKQNETDKRDADRTIADLRAGRERLRDKFTCPRTVPGAAASAGRSDEASEGGLSGQDAEFLVRFASEADTVANRLTACQSILQAER
jgi:hypothetical protein